MSFHDFLDKFIRRILITDSVLTSIGAFELMAFQNRIDQLDFPQQQQTELNILRDYMTSKSITVIEHDDLFFGGTTSIDEPHLAIFRYLKKEDDKEFVSVDELCIELAPDNKAARQRILERRKKSRDAKQIVDIEDMRRMHNKLVFNQHSK